MFTKVDRTDYPPQNKPLLIWDGDCGFCKYWVIKLKRITGDSIDYVPYQESAENLKDLNVEIFKEASRLIETDGKIYSGPDSFYRSLNYTKYNTYKLHSLYEGNYIFRKLSNYGYIIIATNRKAMFRITTFLFGKKP